MFRYSSLIDSLLKAMGHKYIRRIPKGVTKTGATKYAYFYAGQEGHGKGVAHEEELVVGASFAFGEHGKTRYHAHISKVDGDKITIKYDDGAKKGQEETMTKKQFQALVHGEHAAGIKQAREKAAKQLQDFKAGKEKGVKVKQETIDKLEQRIKNLDALTAKKEETKKQAPKESALVTQTTEEIKNALKASESQITETYNLISMLKRLPRTLQERGLAPLNEALTPDALPKYVLDLLMTHDYSESYDKYVNQIVDSNYSKYPYNEKGHWLYEYKQRLLKYPLLNEAIIIPFLKDVASNLPIETINEHHEERMKQIGSKIFSDLFTPLKDVDASKANIQSLSLAKEPANKVMTFLNDVLKTSDESSLRRAYHNVLVSGDNRQILAQTGKMAVLLDNPDSLNIDTNNKAGLIPIEHTKSIAKNKKNETATLTNNKDTFIEDDSINRTFDFLNNLKNDVKTSTISINLSNHLKNKLQAAINALGNRADNMTIDIMYPQDGKISIYFKDDLKSAEPELFDIIPYTTNSELSENPQRKSLRISPRKLSLMLPYVKTWHMSSDFSPKPFVFDGEDKNTTIIHVPE